MGVAVFFVAALCGLDAISSIRSWYLCWSPLTVWYAYKNKQTKTSSLFTRSRFNYYSVKQSGFCQCMNICRKQAGEDPLVETQQKNKWCTKHHKHLSPYWSLVFFNACFDRLSLLTYIPLPRQAAPTIAMYSKFSPPSPVGLVDMWAAGTRVGILALVNPENNFTKS